MSILSNWMQKLQPNTPICTSGWSLSASLVQNLLTYVSASVLDIQLCPITAFLPPHLLISAAVCKPQCLLEVLITDSTGGGARQSTKPSESEVDFWEKRPRFCGSGHRSISPPAVPPSARLSFYHQPMHKGRRRTTNFH